MSNFFPEVAGVGTGCRGFSLGGILVLFILLVIIACACGGWGGW